jgi:protein TIF31
LFAELEVKMAGKSNKGRNRRASHNAANSSDSVVPSDAPAKDNSKDDSTASESIKANANGVPTVQESTSDKLEVKESETNVAVGEPKQDESETENSAGQPKQGEFANMGL